MPEEPPAPEGPAEAEPVHHELDLASTAGVVSSSPEDSGLVSLVAEKAVLVEEALGGPLDTEDLYELLDALGPNLVRAYVRAGDFIQRAHPGIRSDAVRYQADLFHARCLVSVARAAARRVLRGEALLLS